ncbi:MAG: PAS domain-containing protein [Spirochaeta sp.]|jgi:PAS domain S-box-containing protein|nr:PAS domain-containing protein [Spirochaeta sp.]
MQQLFSLFSAVIAALENMEEGLVITDHRQPDAPIVYANKGFIRLTGYAFDEIVGRNCRFLQYEKTDSGELDRLRSAIAHGEPVKVELWNRSKEGREFLNRLSLVPIYGDRAATIATKTASKHDTDSPSYYVGLQSDITDLRHAQERSARLDTLQITMRTVNDITMNAFNGLQSVRESLNGSSQHQDDIALFDAIVGDAAARLRRIEGLQELDTDSSRGVDVLKYEQ